MKGKNIFNNKKAWITGASSGIGEALVYEFIRRGAKVVISSNDIAGLERVKSACLDRSGNIICAPFDLSDTSAIEELAAEQIKTLGGIDFLINIGGISQRARIEETPLWLDRKIFEINYFGTIALTKAELRHIQARSPEFCPTLVSNDLRTVQFLLQNPDYSGFLRSRL